MIANQVSRQIGIKVRTAKVVVNGEKGHSLFINRIPATIVKAHANTEGGITITSYLPTKFAKDNAAKQKPQLLVTMPSGTTSLKGNNFAKVSQFVRSMAQKVKADPECNRPYALRLLSALAEPLKHVR